MQIFLMLTLPHPTPLQQKKKKTNLTPFRIKVSQNMNPVATGL